MRWGARALQSSAPRTHHYERSKPSWTADEVPWTTHLDGTEHGLKCYQDLERLSFVGAGTHPGAGLPGTRLSAEIADRLIGRDLGTANRVLNA